MLPNEDWKKFAVSLVSGNDAGGGDLVPDVPCDRPTHDRETANLI